MASIYRFVRRIRPRYLQFGAVIGAAVLVLAIIPRGTASATPGGQNWNWNGYSENCLDTITQDSTFTFTFTWNFEGTSIPCEWSAPQPGEVVAIQYGTATGSVTETVQSAVESFKVDFGQAGGYGVWIDEYPVGNQPGGDSGTLGDIYITGTPLTVNAGPDRTIYGTHSVSLNGTVSDATAKTTWTELSGPGTATFASNAPQTKVTVPVVSGSYVFQLSATDSGGQSAAATVTMKFVFGAYVALGDSYSAGVGSGGGVSGGRCLQNGNAYPAVWSASHPDDKFIFKACSGGTTASIKRDQLRYITSGTTLITITAGGNDVWFVPVISACSIPSEDTECYLATQLAQHQILGPLATDLSGLFAAIRATAASAGAPNARLIVFDYPHFFQGSGMCGPADVIQQLDINQTIDVLDAVIAKAAGASAGTTFDDIRGAFTGHELCSKNPWLGGIARTWPVTWFHPNAAGQAQGYEAALAAITG